MKRIIVLALTMALSLTACGGSASTSASSAAAASKAPSESTSAVESTPAVESKEDLINSDIDINNPSTTGTSVTFTLNHVGATTHPYQYGCGKFAQLVNAYSNGSMGITVYPASQIASGAKAVEYVQMGTLDMCLESTMSLENFVPEAGVLNLPFMFTSKERAYAVLDGECGEELKTKAESYGFKILCWMNNGFRDISNTVRPIVVPDDLKGIKLRCPESSVFVDTFQQLGATPTTMAISEVFSAMQLGTVDGQENPSSVFVNNKFYEVNKYYSVTHHIYTAEPLILSLDKWNSLTSEQQAILQRAANDACSYERAYSDSVGDSNMQTIADNGVEVNELSADQLAVFQTACEPIYAKYESTYGEMISKIRTEASKVG